MDYKEISEYLSEVSTVMCLLSMVREMDDKLGLPQTIFHKLEEHIPNLSAEKTRGVCRDFEILATDASAEKIKIMIKDLLGGNMILNDGVIEDTLGVFAEKTGDGEDYNEMLAKLTPEMFFEHQGKSTINAIEEVLSFLSYVQWTLHLVCCEHGVTDMKTEFEKFLKDAYREDEEETPTASWLFPDAPRNPNKENEDKRKKGQKGKLTHLQQFHVLLALLNLKRFPFVREEYTVNEGSLLAVSRLFGELFNCHGQQLKNDYTAMRNFDKQMEDKGAHNALSKMAEHIDFAEEFLERHGLRDYR